VLKLEKKEFSYQRAKGSLLEITLPLPPDKQAEMNKFFGPTLVIGWALADEHALFSFGRNADLALQAMVNGLKDSGKNKEGLGNNVAFLKAMNAGPNRVGMLYFSLVDLVRWFEGTGIPEVESIAAALKNKQFKTAPSLDWGVNTSRSQFDVSLHLPVEHFKAFKPILDEFLKKGPATMFAPGKAQWREVPAP